LVQKTIRREKHKSIPLARAFSKRITPAAAPKAATADLDLSRAFFRLLHHKNLDLVKQTQVHQTILLVLALQFCLLD